MQVGMGFWASKTLLSAVELGLFSTLADAPADLPTLQKKLALHQRSARDFLDALVALKLLERESGIYSNTVDTDLFLIAPSHPISAVSWRWQMPGSMASGDRSQRPYALVNCRTRARVEEKTSLRHCMPIRISCGGF